MSERNTSKSSSDSNDQTGIIIAIGFIILLLSYLWVAYGEFVLRIILIIGPIGFVISNYIFLKGFLQTGYRNDHEGLLILLTTETSWLLSLLSIFFAYFLPPKSYYEVFLHAEQFFGILLVVFSILILFIYYLFMSRIYQKATKLIIPKQFESWIINKRWWIVLSTVILSLMGYLFLTGIIQKGFDALLGLK